jgi:hypothetical protein
LGKDTPKSIVPRRPAKLDPVPLRPDQTLHAIGTVEHALIGQVVSEWAYLENCLGELILKCTGMSFEDGRLFTARTDASRIIELLRKLAPRKLQGGHLQNLVDVLALADQLRDDRNFIVHGTWAIMMPEGVPTVSSLRANSEPDIIVTENFPHSRMRAIAVEIRQTRDRVVELLHNATWAFG